MTVGVNESDEWYTPPRYVEAARMVMGGIDLDPASCALAQGWIKAGTFYTREDDGLSHPWFGRVWLNPPYSQPLIQRFMSKLVAERASGRVEQAIVLTNACTDPTWFHRLASWSLAVCFIRGRIAFRSARGSSPGNRMGQAFFYMGSDARGFASVFSAFGTVLHIRG